MKNNLITLHHNNIDLHNELLTIQSALQFITDSAQLDDNTVSILQVLIAYIDNLL